MVKMPPVDESMGIFKYSSERYKTKDEPIFSAIIRKLLIASSVVTAFAM
jgi:hypothetical protein